MTKKILKCIYGGGDACVRQGGSGSRFHGQSYAHNYPTLEEAGEPLGDYVEAVHKGESRTVSVPGLEDSFDEDRSYDALTLDIQRPVFMSDILKSMYDFDLESEEGVTRLMALLPILDDDILKQIVQEIWPGYPVDQDFNPYMQRMQIMGYLLDYLDSE